MYIHITRKRADRSNTGTEELTYGETAKVDGCGCTAQADKAWPP